MVWDTGMQFVKCCGRVRQSFTIAFDPKVYFKIDVLMEEKPRIEWLAYLIGTINWERGYAIVNDLYIPTSQKVSGANVDEIDCHDSMRKKIIGVIHSHHTMGVFFSQDDWDYLNNNHHISIVVSNKSGDNEFLPVVRVKTECDAYTHIEGKIVPYFETTRDELDSFKREITEKITNGIQEFGYQRQGGVVYYNENGEEVDMDDVYGMYPYPDM